MTSNAPKATDRCGNCGHVLKFHVSARIGENMPCDVEMGNVDDPVLCGCGEFIQVADPEEFVPEWKCSICGGEGGEHGLGCVLND